MQVSLLALLLEQQKQHELDADHIILLLRVTEIALNLLLRDFNSDGLSS